jgi:hypothetical protein
MDMCPNCGNTQIVNGNQCDRCGTCEEEDGAIVYDPRQVDDAHDRYRDEIEQDRYNRN